jgi:YggT family protein
MYLVNFIDLLFNALFWVILGSILLSWIDQQQRWPITQFLNSITDPLLAPIRKILPNTGFLDLSPMILLILVQVLRQVLVSALI